MIFGDYTIRDEPPDTQVTATLCAAGSARCVGPWLYTCTGDGNAWEEAQPCASAEHCNSRQGQCRACIPETHRCNSSQLEVCGSDGRWSPVETCDSEDLCNLNSDSCRRCTIDEFQCNNGELLRCSENQTWELIDTCDTVEACVVAEDRRSGSCRTPVCDNPGGHQCNGAQLLRCTLARDRLVEVATCEAPEFCDPAAADLQASQGQLATCLTPCEPNSVRC